MSQVSNTVVDHDFLTKTIAEVIVTKTEREIKEYIKMNVQVSIKKVHSLYFVVELRISPNAIVPFNFYKTQNFFNSIV